MGDTVQTTAKPPINSREAKNEHGLENLVAYYKKMFDRKENLNHYSPEDYKTAKRRFVKYSLKNRIVFEDRP